MAGEKSYGSQGGKSIRATEVAVSQSGVEEAPLHQQVLAVCSHFPNQAFRVWKSSIGKLKGIIAGAQRR